MLLYLWACQPNIVEDTAVSLVHYDAGFMDFEFIDSRGKQLVATVWYPAKRRESSEADNA